MVPALRFRRLVSSCVSCSWRHPCQPAFGWPKAVGSVIHLLCVQLVSDGFAQCLSAPVWCQIVWRMLSALLSTVYYTVLVVASKSVAATCCLAWIAVVCALWLPVVTYPCCLLVPLDPCWLCAGLVLSVSPVVHAPYRLGISSLRHAAVKYERM